MNKIHLQIGRNDALLLLGQTLEFGSDHLADGALDIELGLLDERRRAHTQLLAEHVRTAARVFGENLYNFQMYTPFADQPWRS